jgi:hypothetical protein
MPIRAYILPYRTPLAPFKFEATPLRRTLVSHLEVLEE